MKKKSSQVLDERTDLGTRLKGRRSGQIDWFRQLQRLTAVGFKVDDKYIRGRRARAKANSHVDELVSKRSALRSENWRPNFPSTPSL